MINDEETTLEVVEEEQNDTVETIEEESTEEQNNEENKFRRLYEKSQQEIADLKKPKPNTQATPTLDPIEAALLVGGMSKEVLGQLKKVSALTGKDLLEAQADPVFVAVKEKFEKDQKREDASLPASRGAGAVKAKKDFNTPNLTREEHMAMVQAQL